MSIFSGLLYLLRQLFCFYFICGMIVFSMVHLNQKLIRLRLFQPLIPVESETAEIIYGHPAVEIHRLRINLEFLSMNTSPEEKNDLALSPADLPVEPSGLNRSTDTNLLFYNRVPKCGSMTVMSQIWAFVKYNKFTIRNGPILIMPKNKLEEILLAREIYSHNVSAAVYNTHTYFIDFHQLGIPRRLQPNYINVIRDPVERQFSRVLYMKTILHNQTLANFNIDECFRRHLDPVCNLAPKALQICYFAGNIPPCHETKFKNESSQEILNKAKHNAEHFYSVVGLTENLEDTFRLFEAFLPRFFKRSHSRYRILQTRENVNVKKINKQIPNGFRDFLMSHPAIGMELDFYDFIKQRFKLQLEATDSFVPEETF